MSEKPLGPPPSGPSTPGDTTAPTCHSSGGRRMGLCHSGQGPRSSGSDLHVSCLSRLGCCWSSLGAVCVHVHPLFTYSCGDPTSPRPLLLYFHFMIDKLLDV